MLISAATSLWSCGGNQGSGTDRTPSKGEVISLIGTTSEFQESATVHIARAIAVEPKFGRGQAAAFAASLGRDSLDADALWSLAPGVAALYDAQLVRLQDSPIPERFESDAPPASGRPGDASGLLVPEHQRAHRYWRHYLRVEPVDLGAEEWVPEGGSDEVDETSTSARVVRTPGWRALVARREIVAVDSVRASGDSLSVVYRWRWAPSRIGAPFMARDTAGADHLATAGYVDAPVLVPTEHRATAMFFRTAEGWKPAGAPAAVSASGAAQP